MTARFAELSVEELYPIIARSLMRCLPEAWRDVTLIYEWVDSDVTRSHAFLHNPSGKKEYIRLRPAGEDLEDALMELARKMDEAGHPRWQKATFTLDRSGQFTLDFDYPPDGAPRPARP